jgi:hypothetical protein
MKTTLLALIVKSPSQVDTNQISTNQVELGDIRPIKSPMVISDPWMWFFIIATILVLGALAYFIWKKWRKAKPLTASTPPLPPHMRALQRLQEVMGMITDPYRFISAVSDIIRQYIEERFDLKAPERTTEEFLLEMKYSPVLAPAHKEQLADFLNRCDLVKFARYEPTETELGEIHHVAVRLVDETQPPPPSPEP